MNDTWELLTRRTMGPIALPVSREECRGVLSAWGPRGEELMQLLAHRNGFFAFESALLVRPLLDAPPVWGLVTWNDVSQWKGVYSTLTESLFFAEDVFGNPFAILDEQIVSVDAETGEVDGHWPTLRVWAEAILIESALLAGWPMAHEWQEKHGAIPLGKRLLPRRPFVLGGNYVMDNLVLAPDVEGMRARGRLARQLRDLPAGGEVAYELRVG
jgi:hypothetical protein